MRLHNVVVVIAVVILCYIGAGAPSVLLLFKPAVISQALALKPVTWHWLNHVDRAIPIAELLASRFYVLLVAALCAMVAGCAFGVFATKRRFTYMLTMSLAVVVIFVYAQIQAYYTVA
jgi:ABC-type branched-subunit amino acid transport system permease subunit